MGSKTRDNYPSGGWCSERATCAGFDEFCRMCWEKDQFKEIKEGEKDAVDSDA